MLADISIIPIGDGPHTSETLAEVLKVIDGSGVAYQLTPTTTCVEGTWEQIAGLARQCHEVARRRHAHVITELRIEDDGTDHPKLRRNVDSVEAKAGMTFNKQVAGAGVA